MRRPAYGERSFRAAKQILRGRPCHRCGSPSTTVDHQPPLALHHHVEGTNCCRLLSACAPCNASDGATIGNRIRHLTANPGLVPGSGWAR